MDRIKPMLAAASTTANNRPAVKIETLEGDYTFDLKLDGLRAIAYWEDSKLTLINRNGVDITAQFPEIHMDAKLPMVLDGEIVACDGRFQTVATRGKQTKAALIKASSKINPCKFVAFDLLEYDGRSYLNETYFQRRAQLNDLRLSSWVERSVISPSASFLDIVRQQGMEGVIAKRNESRYAPGGRNRDWIKFKVLHSITAIAVGYEAGTGSRAHFGAMTLALLDQQHNVVPLGRVGTGFTEAEILDLKSRLDAGMPTLVEIECLNRTADGSLRFPVYKHIRNDVSILDANIAQLDTLPLC